MKWKDRAGFASLPKHQREMAAADTPYYPEGGWGYVVVLAAFSALMVQMGLIVSMGVYLEHIEHEFHSGAGLSGWISSGCFAVLAFMCPFAGHVMKRFGCRFTAMVGGAIMCTGFVCGTFAMSVVQLFIFVDVIAGVGASMCHISATVVIGQYFNKRYALVNGFAYMGQGIGIFVFPPILETLIQEYGWRGCFLIQGAISLHITLAASLYRPVKRPTANGRKHRLRDAGNSTASPESIVHCPSVHREEHQSQSQNNGVDSNPCSSVSGHAQFSDDSGTNSAPISASELASSKSAVAADSTISLRHVALNGKSTEFVYEERLDFFKNTKFVDGNSVDSSDLGADCCGSFSSLCNADMHSHPTHPGNIGTTKDKLEVQFSENSGMESPTVAFSSSTTPHDSTASLTRKGVQIHVSHPKKCEEELCPDEEELGSFRGTEADQTVPKKTDWLVGWHLIRNNPSIHFIFAVFLFETFGYGGFFSHVVARVGEIGIPERQATFALSIFGIGSLVGRATNGWIVDRGVLTPKNLNALSLVISGCASVLTAMVASHPGVLAGSFFSGLGSGWYLPLQQVLLRNIVGQSKLHLAYGYGLVFEGAGSLAGGFVIGYIRDVSGTYEFSFYFLGVVFLLGAAIFALDHICERRGSHRSNCPGDGLRYSLDTKKELTASGYDQATPV